jgi:two-component system sensor kinase FixL
MTRTAKRRERYRTLPALLVAMAVIVLGLGWGALRFVRHRLVAAAGESLQLAAVDIASAMDLALYDRFRELRTAVSASVGRFGTPDEVSTYLRALHAADPGYLWLGKTDAAGRIEAATSNATIGVDVSARAWFRAVRATGGADVRDGTTSVAITVPVVGVIGTFEGVVSAHVGFGALQGAWLRTVHVLRERWGTWIDWQFLTPDGELVDDGLGRSRSTARDMLGIEPRGGVLAAGYVEGMDHERQRPMVLGYAKTRGYMDYPGLGWTVIIRMDKAGILAPVDRIVGTLAALGGGAVVPLFGLLLWSVRRLRAEWLEAETATDRARAAEAERRARETEIRAIVETASDAIITTDAAGRIASINLAGERMFGYGAGELMGRPIGLLVPALDAGDDGHGPRWRTAMIDPDTGAGAELTGCRRDGTPLPIEMGVGEVALPERRLFTAVVRDVSARKLAEARAREHQATLAHVLRMSSLGEMAAGVAHELNQPLTAIASYALAGSEELRAGDGGRAAVMDVLEKIEGEARRAGSIVHRLRDLVCKVTPQREETRLAACIANVERIVRPLITKATIALECELPAADLRVYADPIQLEQVLINVVQNAIDSLRVSGRSDGRIRLRATRGDGGTVETTVSDNGAGVSAEVAERMFDAFFTTKPEGLGMGLAISRAVVEAHGGRLWATSNTGPGIIMHLSFPEYVETPNHGV